MAPDKRKRAKRSDLSKFMTIDAFFDIRSSVPTEHFGSEAEVSTTIFVTVTEVHSVNPSNQAGSYATGTALSPTDGSLGSGRVQSPIFIHSWLKEMTNHSQ